MTLSVWQQAADISALQSLGVKAESIRLSRAEVEKPIAAAPPAAELPYGGDMMQAMRAGDRDAIRKIMEARRPREDGADGADLAEGDGAAETSAGPTDGSAAGSAGGKPVAPASDAKCAVCFDDLDGGALAICAKAHAFCSDCLQRHVQT